ncbi:MAG: hypothetical protein ACOCWG_06110 [bacterium]
MNIRQFVKRIIDIPGFHTKRKFLIIVSDDWGGVRLKSKQAREKLKSLGIEMDSRFERFDTLESNFDMESLFEVLLKHKNYYGQHPVITAVTNVANPDFVRIKENKFSEYFYEPFVETLKRYHNHDKVYGYYNEGCKLDIFKPELHGREHLHISKWMKHLQKKDALVLKAFENEYWYLKNLDSTNKMNKGLEAAFNITDLQDVSEQKSIIRSASKIFTELFKYPALYFTAPSQVFNKKLEPVFKEVGIKLIDVPRFRRMPISNNRYSRKIHYLGQQNSLGQYYFIRNIVFEPGYFSESNVVDNCLHEIERTFKQGMPAIISNHRVSFMGGINPLNREYGLKALDSLLQKVLIKWPDIEFFSVADFSKLLENRD